MTTSGDRLNYLYRQYINKTCSQQEMEEFFIYVRDPAYKEALETIMDRQLETMETPSGVPGMDWEHMYRTIMPPKHRNKASIFRLSRVAAAACIILAGAGAWFFFTRRQPRAEPPIAAEKVIPPGYNKATLTLSNGSIITLDSTHTGELAKQGDATIINTGNGSLAYTNATGESSPAVLYNTLTTPRGGQYQLLLPDGTKVWLNASSSITYPTAFKGNERMVQITGEAYFEVTHDKSKPFRVKAGSQTIEDIGTRFNVNAYSDEPASITTLLEGAVKIGTHMLKPGEKASAAPDGEVIVSKGDPVRAVAWKNGFFDFSDASLQAVMRQLARWYNVEIQYEGNIRERQFNGMIGRSLTLSQVLSGLSAQAVHYRIEENNHLIITP
ncbi:MAG: FecR domain-containing protein [Bacteroidetes bacterium]|nr:FecR domain-containing protein [Bacteroidota bacterium]